MERTIVEPIVRKMISAVAVVGRARQGNPVARVADNKSARLKQAWWLWPHLLGLDAPLVALTWQDWWSRADGMPLQVSERVTLGLGVWMIYLADRLADTARGSPEDSATARHAFARVWRGPLSAVTVLIGMSLVVLTPFTLPPGQFCGGLILLSTAGLYFWMIHRRGSPSWTARIPKEAAVGAIFAIGSAFFVICRATLPGARLGFAVVLFGMACFLNCALITSWERNLRDRRDPFSLLNAFPTLVTRGLRPFAWSLVAIAALAGAAMHATVFLPVVLGVLSLTMLDRWRRHFSPDALRSLADVVLLTPWICDAVLAVIQ